MGGNQQGLTQWIDQTTFGSLFTSLENPVIDPSTVVVSGLLNQDGSLTLGPWYTYPNGVLSESIPGNFAIQSLDSNGDPTSQITLNPQFMLDVKPPENIGNTSQQFGSVPTATTPFVVAVSNSPDLSAISFGLSGKVISTISPQAQLLENAIQSIPNSSFIKKPQQERNALIKRAKEIEAILSDCRKIQSDKLHDNWLKIACTDIAENQVLDLRKRLNRELNDSTATTSPLQMTKGQVMSTVDLVALNLLGSPTIQAAGHSVVIRILPPENGEIFTIISVTQGTNGAVNINKNGTVTYVPSTRKPESDSFSVTVQDQEGASVTKTISIVAPCLDDQKIARWESRFQ
jgi:hypothetical protein